ncbi:DUF6516 family protein [Beijerinckia sp. L45]|uniref:toxin-antitoxin system TumE family protein n=1 Tax=Beijerinckia sp. L45 TaxID=1641855 RepID=UPI00131B8AC4|nr:DUF6516 family protein [Beijerinckia sp. L45]
MATKARLLFHRKRHYDDGAILEMKLWRVPIAVPGSQHALKYSLYYGRDGERLVGYDNERGKGDHRHYGGREAPYIFVSAAVLIDDFLADVEILRGGSL